MRLHNAEEDRASFRALIERIHEKTGHRRDVLEKDYYVVLMLNELSKMQEGGLPAYFKGGTALYKALKTTNRFSEDIDISVEARNRAFEAAKHIYDLAVLYNHPRTKDLYKNTDMMASLLRIRLAEEKERHDGIPGIPPSEFTFFEDAKTDEKVANAYDTMQHQYVLRDQDRISYDEALSRLQFIKTNLDNNPSWANIKA